jgi:hypothetical protein
MLQTTGAVHIPEGFPYQMLYGAVFFRLFQTNANVFLFHYFFPPDDCRRQYGEVRLIVRNLPVSGQSPVL